jgi:hypothetical protein
MKNVNKNQIVVKAPVNKINSFVNSRLYEGKDLDIKKLSEFGVYVIRDFFDKKFIETMYEEYVFLLRSEQINKDNFHRTQVRISEEQRFSDVLKSDSFVALAKKIFPLGAALDFMRIVKKDETNPDPVFLHSDAVYNVGWFEAYSCFIPLTTCSEKNGGLSFYPGTHNFGHLGDAGGIAPILPTEYPKLCPRVSPGDVIVMHAGTWHESGAHNGCVPRVYLEFAFRSLMDPAAKKLIHGLDEREWVLTISVDDLFTDSREQRIRRLSNKG